MSIISLGSTCAVSNYLKEKNLRKESYPFDWCRININQLNKVLANNFNNYNDLSIKKYCEKFPYNENENLGSLVLENNYNIKFAHEVLDKYSVEDFKERLVERIKRFKLLKNPTFIRYEDIGKMKNNYIQNVIDLLINLTSFFDNFKLILLVPNNYDIKLNIDNLQIIKYNIPDDYNWKNESAFTLI
jgi:ribosomal protein L33